MTKGVHVYKCDDLLCTYTSGQDFVMSEYETEFYSYDGQEFEWKDLEIVSNKYQNVDIIKMTKETFQKLFEQEK